MKRHNPACRAVTLLCLLISNVFAFLWISGRSLHFIGDNFESVAKFEDLLVNFTFYNQSSKDTSSSQLEPFSIVRDALHCNMSALMQRNDFISLVQWRIEGNESAPKLSVGNCSLQNITREIATKCFEQNSPHGIMFMGDSLSRFQYINLAYFFVHRSWSNSDSRSNANQHHFANYKEFFKVTNDRMDGHEICDCFHVDNIERIEHRYFQYGKVKLSFRQIFGKTTRVLMHDVESLNISSCSKSQCAQRLCLPGECHHSVHPIYDLGTVLDAGVIQKLAETIPTSDVIFNAGHWWPVNGENGFVHYKQVLVEEVRNLRSNSSSDVRFHWKITTASLDNYVKPEFEFAHTLKATEGILFFDAWSLTKPIADGFPSLFWDHVHFESAVNTGLNQALIAYICSQTRD